MEDWNARRLRIKRGIDARKAATESDASPESDGKKMPRQGMVMASDGRPRFGKGNKFGKGWARTHAVKRAFQKAFFSAVTDEDIREIAQACVKSAKKGNLYAAREIFDRCLGKPDETMVVKRLRELEDLYMNGKPPEGPIKFRPAETA